MASRRPSWWRPFCDAPNLFAQIASVVALHERETCLTWLDDRGAESKVLTFGALWRRAGVLAQLLLGPWGRARGERVLLCFAPGPEFFVMFWACLRAGVIAVPVYPPDPAKMQKAIDKMALVTTACGATLCLCDSMVIALKRTKGLLYRWPRELKWRSIEGLGEGGDNAELPATPALDEATPSDLAFLQFTSGSTGDPKGVMISHANLWANVNELILPMWERGFELAGLAHGGRRTGCSWLPQYHDLGLVVMHIAPFVAGHHVVYLSPITFLIAPELWVVAAARYKANHIAAPDFGYKLVVKRGAKAVAALRSQGIDLCELKLCLSAAERVHQETCAEFERLFRSELGFAARWALSYGLAESVVCVSSCTSTPPQPRKLTCAEEIVCSSARPDIVCVGEELLVTIRIVDKETREEKPCGCAGEIWVSSSSVAAGYWGKPELSDETFRAQLQPDDGRTYLRTGDEGYFEASDVQGESERLFVCGRLKDLIILGGKNYYPEDVEFAITDACPEVRPGCVAAFSVEEGGVEVLVVVFEIRAAAEKSAAAVCRAARAAAASDAGLAPGRVVAVKEKTIPKTTSGKIQRRATRAALEAAALKHVYDTATERPSAARALATPTGADASSGVPPPVALTTALEEDSGGWWAAAVAAWRWSVGSSTPVQEPAGGVDGTALEAATATQIAAVARTRQPTSDVAATVGVEEVVEELKSWTVSLETVLALAERTAGGAVDADMPLLEAGLDSLGAVELRNQLQQALER